MALRSVGSRGAQIVLSEIRVTTVLLHTLWSLASTDAETTAAGICTETSRAGTVSGSRISQLSLVRTKGQAFGPHPPRKRQEELLSVKPREI